MKYLYFSCEAAMKPARLDFRRDNYYMDNNKDDLYLYSRNKHMYKITIGFLLLARYIMIFDLGCELPCRFSNYLKKFITLLQHVTII